MSLLKLCSPEEVGMSPEQLALIRERGASWCDGVVHSALVLLVARRGKVVLREVYGRLRPEPDAPPVQLDTLFPVASISKPMTATAIMMLVERGLLGLNRPVAEYIPEFNGRYKKLVLIHHLLNHTSGLDEHRLDRHILEKTGTNEILTQVPTSDIVRTYLELGYDCPHVCPPGERHYYSLYGYELLGEIITRVTGQPFHTFIAENIFRPLGMDNSWFVPPEQVYGRIIQRPDNAPFASPQSPRFGALPQTIQTVVQFNRELWRKNAWANASCHCTAEDVLRFGQLFLNGGQFDGRRLLSTASVSLMTTNQTQGAGIWFGEEKISETADYGYGWVVKGESVILRSPSLISPASFSHTGAGGSDVTVDPERELVTVYFSTELQKGRFEEHFWQNDLFNNMVVAAVVD